MSRSGVSLGDDRDTQNGVFRVWATFHLVVGDSDFELISLWVGYYAQGCLCYADAGELSLDGRALPSFLGHVDVRPSLRLRADHTYTLNYSGSHRPPLMQQTPASVNAEYGELVIETKLRPSGKGDLREIQSIFRFDPESDPVEVQEIREPPRLSNGELEHWRAIGRLSVEQCSELLVLPARLRYLASISRESSALTANIPREAVRLLQTLYREGPPDITA